VTHSIGFIVFLSRNSEQNKRAVIQMFIHEHRRVY